MFQSMLQSILKNKKLVAIILACVLFLGILLGVILAINARKNEEPVAIGRFVLSAEASVILSYDKNGAVLTIDGVNDHGVLLLDEYTDYYGKSCAAVIKELLDKLTTAKHLTADSKYVILKHSFHSEVPNEEFLTSIRTETEAALAAISSTAKLAFIEQTALKDDGYMTLQTAKSILLLHLGAEEFDYYVGPDALSGEEYLCTVTVNGVKASYCINAFSGLIDTASEEQVESYIHEFEEQENEQIYEDLTEFEEDT